MSAHKLLISVCALASCVTSSSLTIDGSSPVSSGTSSGAGRVVSNPPGIDCKITLGAITGACSASFADYTVVTLTATPSSPSSFTGWEDLASGTDFDYEETLGFQAMGFVMTNPFSMNVDKARTLEVLAAFTAPPK